MIYVVCIHFKEGDIVGYVLSDEAEKKVVFDRHPGYQFIVSHDIDGANAEAHYWAVAFDLKVEGDLFIPGEPTPFQAYKFNVARETMPSPPSAPSDTIPVPSLGDLEEQLKTLKPAEVAQILFNAEIVNWDGRLTNTYLDELLSCFGG